MPGPEGGTSGEMVGAAPDQIGAVFLQGKSKNAVIDWYSELRPRPILVPVLDVTKDHQRERWLLENMNVFLDGTVAKPEARWKNIAADWLSELKVATRRARFSHRGAGAPEDDDFFTREKSKETEKDLKAIMAVCSSARAMEVSAGTASAYLTWITHSEEGKQLDVQDTWADFLLHNDPGKLQRLVGYEKMGRDRDGHVIAEKMAKSPLTTMIAYYYHRMVEDAGVELDQRLRDGVSFVDVDKAKAYSGDLIGYLSTSENPYEVVPEDEPAAEKILREEKATYWHKSGDHNSFRDVPRRESPVEKRLREEKAEKWEKFEERGMDAYVENVLLAGDQADLIDRAKNYWGADIRRAAAKIASDAFLVHLYTRWEYNVDKEGALRIKPIETWGGDPFRALLEPSFLPRRIKKMYPNDEEDRDNLILDLADAAFRPDAFELNTDLPREQREAIQREIGKNLLVPSATVHLKSYARYSNALWSFFGESSRAAGLPLWDRNAMEKHLPSIVENLDQVYGGMSIKDKRHPENNFKNLGKHVMGLVMMRLINCKSLAATAESLRPGVKENLAILFGDPKERPFLELRQFLYGQFEDARSGFFARLQGSRLRIIIGDSIFDNEVGERWNETFDLLQTNDQDPEGRITQRRLNKLGFVLDVLTALSEIGKRRR